MEFKFICTFSSFSLISARIRQFRFRFEGHKIRSVEHAGRWVKSVVIAELLSALKDERDLIIVLQLLQWRVVLITTFHCRASFAAEKNYVNIFAVGFY
jgi:hypothetical protein